MLIDLLKQQGISAEIHGEHLQGAVGGLPAGSLVRVIVDDADYATARLAINSWEAAESASRPKKHKPPTYTGLMGLFIGLAIGIAGMYGVYRIPAAVDGTDYNRDGLLDEKWTYSPSGRPLKMESDRNYDHKIDFIVNYDMRGQPASALSDDDFNGTFETKTTYKYGNPLLEEVDTDGDGYPDVRRHYKDGVLESVQYIQPTTGLPLRVEQYKLGTMVVSADIDSDGDGKLDTRLTYSPLGEVTTRQPVPHSAVQ